MFTLYTSIGQLTIQTDKHGERTPVVIANNREHILDIQEMIIWSSLMWNIMTDDELRPVFNRKEREAHVMSDMCCEDYLKRLVWRGLVITGRDITGYEALYNLIKNLHIVPATSNLLTKIITFLKLTFIKRISIRQAIAIFKAEKLSSEEKKVIRLIGQEQLTTAELIMCIDKGVRSFNSHNTMLDTLYSDKKTTCYNIAVPAKFCEKRQSVMQAVTDLYLRKQILFERIL